MLCTFKHYRAIHSDPTDISKNLEELNACFPPNRWKWKHRNATLSSTRHEKHQLQNLLFISSLSCIAFIPNQPLREISGFLASSHSTAEAFNFACLLSVDQVAHNGFLESCRHGVREKLAIKLCGAEESCRFGWWCCVIMIILHCFHTVNPTCRTVSLWKLHLCNQTSKWSVGPSRQSGHVGTATIR